MGVNSEAFKAELGCVKVQKIETLGACNAAGGGGSDRVVSTDWGVGPVLFFRRWRKRRAAAETGLLCSRSVDSMVVDSPMIQLF